MFDFARFIFVSLPFPSYDYCFHCGSFSSSHLVFFPSEKPMCQNKERDASVGSVAKAFGPTGTLKSDITDVVSYFVDQKYRDTDKLIVPTGSQSVFLLCT